MTPSGLAAAATQLSGTAPYLAGVYFSPDVVILFNSQAWYNIRDSYCSGFDTAFVTVCKHCIPEKRVLEIYYTDVLQAQTKYVWCAAPDDLCDLIVQCGYCCGIHFVALAVPAVDAAHIAAETCRLHMHL
jgi:hypothetical protein